MPTYKNDSDQALTVIDKAGAQINILPGETVETYEVRDDLVAAGWTKEADTPYLDRSALRKEYALAPNVVLIEEKTINDGIRRSIEARKVIIEGAGDLYWPDEENGLDVRNMPRKYLDASIACYNNVKGEGGAWGVDTLLWQGSHDQVEWHDIASLTENGKRADYTSYPFVRLKVASASAIKVGANLRCEEN